jgi:hypothetical protein
MPLELSNDDHDTLDEFVTTILAEHRLGNLTLHEARDAIAEAFTLAALDNASVIRYMQALIATRGKPL